MANFFDDETTNVEEQIQEQPATIKLGEKEYSQDELQKLVGLGQQAVELEEKWDTKIDRLMPEFSKSREEIKSLREQVETKAQIKIEEKESKGEGLSPEEQKKLLKEELKKLDVMTTDDFEEKYWNRRAGEKLYETTESVISRAEKDGLPKTTPEELLSYMGETGIKKPEVAYEVMFKSQLRDIELRKLQSLRPQGLHTTSESTAGAKQPQQVSVTRNNMGSLLDEVLSRGGGQ